MMRLFRTFWSGHSYFLKFKGSFLTIATPIFLIIFLLKSNPIRWSAALICISVHVVVCLTQLYSIFFGRKENVKFIDVFLISHKITSDNLYDLKNPEIYLKKHYVNLYRLCMFMHPLSFWVAGIVFLIEHIKF